MLFTIGKMLLILLKNNFVLSLMELQSQLVKFLFIMLGLLLLKPFWEGKMLIGLVLVSVSVKTKTVELVNNTLKKTRLKFLKDWIKSQLLGLGLSIFLLINLEMDIFHLLIWTMILSQISLLSEDIIGEELIVMNLTNLSTRKKNRIKDHW